jgi:hypothetical protein
MIDSQPSLAREVSEKTNIMPYLLQRVCAKAFDENKLYSR